MYYSRLLSNVILPIGDFLFGSRLSKNLKQVQQSFDDDESNIIQNRNQKLNKHLDFVLGNSKYYGALEVLQIENALLKLKSFPILTKDLIRSNLENILTVEKSKLICNSTSGSTGIQTNIYISKEEQSLIRAIQTTWWKWAGFKMGEPMFQTGLATKRSLEKKLKDIFFRTYYQFAFGLTTENTEKGLTWAKRTIPFLGGYASSLFVLSKIAQGRGITMKSAVSWGDKLFDHYRKNIEQVFDCKVFETYGTGEGLMLGAQKDLDYLYIMDPYFIVELLDDDGNEVADGEIGQVVVTSLIHKSMPLIRYRVGDLAIKLPRDMYPEKRELGLSLFQKIIGRETDIVKTPSGKSLIVHSFTGIFEYFPQVKQFQVVQSKQKLDLTIRYIKGADFDEHTLQTIKKQLDNLAGENLPVEFVEVNIIQATKSGKPQIVVIED